MSIEATIRSTIAMLNTCHVVGSEAETFACAMRNLKTVAEFLKEKRKEQNENQDEQGE